jgi:hypothetical protein
MAAPGASEQRFGGDWESNNNIIPPAILIIIGARTRLLVQPNLRR